MDGRYEQILLCPSSLKANSSLERLYEGFPSRTDGLSGGVDLLLNYVALSALEGVDY